MVFPWPPAANGHSRDYWPKLPESSFIFSGARTCLLNNKLGSNNIYISLTNHYKDLWSILFFIECIVYMKYMILNTNPPVCNEQNVWMASTKNQVENNHQRQPPQSQPMHARDADKPWLQHLTHVGHGMSSCHLCTKSSSTNLKTTLDVFPLSCRFHWRLISVKVSPSLFRKGIRHDKCLFEGKCSTAIPINQPRVSKQLHKNLNF